MLQQKAPVLIDEVCNREPCEDGEKIGKEADASEKAVAKVNRDPEEGDHRPDDYGHQGNETGGADRDRTDDLLNAIQALSQLSYSPNSEQDRRPEFLNLLIDAGENVTFIFPPCQGERPGRIFLRYGTLDPNDDTNDDESSIVTFVASEPGAIGYVRKENLNNSVKVIRWDGKEEF